MAKIVLPSYIKEGHGRMDDAVLVKWKGITYMKPYKRSESRTESQELIREAFKTVVADWKSLGGIVKKSWDFYAKELDMTGFNAFVGANIAHRRAGEPMELSKGMGEELLMNFTAAPGASAGEIVCSFLPAEKGCHISIFTGRTSPVDGQPQLTRHDLGADAASPFTVTSLEPGSEYHLFAIVTDSAYPDAATVSVSVSATSLAG